MVPIDFREPLSPVPSAVDGENELSRWFADYVDSGRAKLMFPLRDPLRTVRMLRALRSLPRLTVQPSSGSDGRFIRSSLQRPLIVRAALGGTISVLTIPDRVADFTAGRAKHALRQKLRSAEGMRLRFRTVDDADDRALLLRHADDYERTGAVVGMRNPHARNDDLLRLRQWLLVESADGVPLLLAVAAVDGELAVLRYYRTLSSSREASVARYAAMLELVGLLASQGVRWLAETGRPHWVHNGVRQFQRKVGFRLVRISLRGPAGVGPARGCEVHVDLDRPSG